MLQIIYYKYVVNFISTFLADSFIDSSQIIEASDNSLPVYGDSLTALFIFLGAIAITLIFYYILNHLPYSKKEKLSPNKEVLLAKISAGFIFSALVSAGWDVWWHRAVGRNTFWEPPHIFLYSFVMLAIFSGIYGWYRTRKNVWKHIATILAFIPLIAPFDNYWHVLFGVEDLSKPISLSWAPPHALLDISAIIALFLHIPILKHEHKQTSLTFFIDLAFAAIFVMILFLIMPFHPTEGWGQVAGFWGAGVIAFAYVGVMILSQKVLGSPYDIIRITAYSLLLILVAFGREIAPGIITLPHDRPPIWLLVSSFLVASIFLDRSQKLPSVLRGAITGIIWAGLLFGLSRNFFDPKFYYSGIEILQAVLSSAVGGILAILLANHFFKQIFSKLGISS